MGLLDYTEAARNKLKGLLGDRPLESAHNALAGLLGQMPITRIAKGDGAQVVNELSKWADAERARKPFSTKNLEGDFNQALQFWNPGGLLGKIVYHGSPHKFDKFDASKIGTGEGAQAYGHGLYAAESPDVAKAYIPASAKFPDLVKPMYERAKNRSVKSGNDGASEVYEMYMHGSTPAAVDSTIKRFAEEGTAHPLYLKAMRAANKRTMALYEQNAQGALYKADLPDEWIPKMLDWDKPLSQQSKEVQKIAADNGVPLDKEGKYLYLNAMNAGPGERVGRGQAGASSALQEAGIPGIKYLDGGSRGKGQGSYNYVVFPGLEDQVKILERNGKGLLGQ